MVMVEAVADTEALVGWPVMVPAAGGVGPGSPMATAPNATDRDLKFTGLTHNFPLDPAILLIIPIREC